MKKNFAKTIIIRNIVQFLLRKCFAKATKSIF